MTTAIYHPRPLRRQSAYAGHHDGNGLQMSDDLARRIPAFPSTPTWATWIRSACATPWLRRWDSGTHADPTCYRAMNHPKVQTDVPAEGASPDQNPTGKTPYGIPDELANGEPASRPSPDRMATEIAVLKSGED